MNGDSTNDHPHSTPFGGSPGGPRLTAAPGACSSFNRISRRHLLKVGGLGLLGLTMPGLLRAAAAQKKAPTARAKSVIFLFQFGGPSHIDMFDMKPDAPEAIRGPLKQISSNVPGMPVCANLPEVLRSDGARAAGGRHSVEGFARIVSGLWFGG
jgi:hypothetical protein